MSLLTYASYGTSRESPRIVRRTHIFLEVNMAKNDEDKKDPTLLKIQDMIEYAFPQIDGFPRPERGYEGMATRLKGIMSRMADNCIDTKKCYYPKSLLKQLDELDKEIQHCKFWVKVAYRTKLFSYKNFEVINDYLTQIGKMTGSWMDTVRKAIEKENYGRK